VSTEATALESNPYSPPQARVADAPSDADAALYIVAPWKFLVMMVGTLSLYSVYWFYKNWSLLNRRHQAYWPVPRAIFAVFFTHALFDHIDDRLRRNAPSFAWSPRALATVNVVCALVRGVGSRIPAAVVDTGVMTLFNLSLLIPMFYALYRAQRAINVAENDPQGTRNNSLTLANIAWLVLGVLWIALVAVGLFMILSGRQRVA